MSFQGAQTASRIFPARKRFRSRLCFIAHPDAEAPGSPAFQAQIRAAVKGGCTSLQLRGKNLSTRQFIEAALSAQKVLQEFPGTPLIINDRVDVALAVDADGVHLGQQDMPASTARQLLGPTKYVGVTVSNPAQAKEALFYGADYLGTDAIFATSTKPDSNVLGLQNFARICASTSLPVLGVGGINPDSAVEVLSAGAYGYAAASYIASATNPEQAAFNLNHILQRLTCYRPDWSRKVASLWTQLRLQKPMIQHLTNYVVMNSTANVTTAVGATPVMSHETELVPQAAAVLINTGTLDETWISRYRAVATAANAAKKPIVLDPVGAGSTALRTDTALEMLTKFRFACVRANAGEMGVLGKDPEARVRGVDIGNYLPSNPVELVKRVAKTYNTVAAMTGKIDYVSDGETTLQIHNGSSMLPDVSGSGCAASAVVSAMLATVENTNTKPIDAVVSGLTCFNIASEKAEERLLRSAHVVGTRGPATYWNAVLDELYDLKEEDIIDRAQIRHGFSSDHTTN